ncbi:MAG TPA: thioredoxin family protein [Burkholderiaceae bacterium]|nr:thioredoxin family protein [Burkholderiaceae bacterium]
MSFRRFAPASLLAAALALIAPFAHADTSKVTTEQVRAELVADAPEGVGPDKPVWLGLRITHAPHWHTYWKNPGDSGLPTRVEWTLPEGVTAGEIDWPTPKRLPIGTLMNYGYEDTVLLPVKLQVPANWQGSKLDIKLHADWLVCKTECIPQSGDFRLSLPATVTTALNHGEFEEAWARRPVAAPRALAAAHVGSDGLTLTVSGLGASLQGKQAVFFPQTPNIIDNAAAVEQRWNGDSFEARVKLSSQRTESPASLPGVFVFDGERSGVALTAAVSGAWPRAADAVQVPAALQAAIDADRGAAPAAAAGAGGTSLSGALLLALVGGLILNLMPCVFPVLSLKVLGYAQHAHSPRERVGGGVAYVVGVVLSFLALAGVLLALRAAGEQLGWGFQLQSPGFVAALAALFTLIGLNLAGVFEFGSVLPSGVASLRARHPMVDSFLTGVLAVAVASPCTAPFMGASLGAAATLPAAQALAVFGSLGLGMALPYLLLTCIPALGRMLPRPGVWMLRFKQVMAFPMFVTVVWLTWVVGQQTGIDGAAALLAVLVVLAFAAWALGSPGMGRAARLGFGGVAIALLAGSLAWAVPAWRQAASLAHAEATPAAGSKWSPWSAQKVAELTAQGKPVFVDFTAAWCVTCQYNKRTTLSNAQVMADFAQKGVTLLRADWTSRDAAITAELARLGRAGVPVYVFYAAGRDKPLVLNEVLSVDEVRSAIASL